MTTIDMTEWFDEHADYLFRFAKRHFRDQVVVEDLVQETFLAALEASSRFQGHSSPRTWLTSILRHKIIDRIRKAGREVTPNLEGMESLDEYFDRTGHWYQGDVKAHWHNSPEAGQANSEFLAALRKCMEDLPENHRRVFLLREVTELEAEEVCNLLEISATNLRVMLHRSRLALQKCISLRWLSIDGGTMDPGTMDPGTMDGGR